jgi:hypothetical protein
MGKRDGDKFERVEKDFYSTVDPAAIVPAFVDRIRGINYAEPCYGKGLLEDMLVDVATCKWRSDIREDAWCILAMDAVNLTRDDMADVDAIITNPPYKWDMLQPLLDHLPTLRPTWLLMPSDYMNNVRMGPYMKRCETIIAVGRLYWLPNKIKGVSNFAWYKFNNWHIGQTEFIGRAG